MTEEFKELVAKDVRNECSQEELNQLMGNTTDWLQVLNKLKRDVEVQLVAQKARMTRTQADMLDTGTRSDWLRYKAEEEKWRVGAVRFMVSVEDKIMHVKGLRKPQAVTAGA